MRSLDTETTGIDLHHGAKPFLVTTYDGEDNLYWEWDVDPMTREPIIPESDLEDIREIVGQSNLILHNAKFDVLALSAIDEQIGWYWDWSKTFCTLMASHILASNQPHDLTSLAVIYLKMNIQPYEDAVEQAVKKARHFARMNFPKWMIASKDLVDIMPSANSQGNKSTKDLDKVWKYDMWLPRAIAKEEDYPEDHPWWDVTAEYANADSFITYHLQVILEVMLREKNLWDIFVERMKLLPVVFDMEYKGVTANAERTSSMLNNYIEESKYLGEVCLGIAKSYDYDLTLPKSGNNRSLKGFVFTSKGLGIESVTNSPKTGEPSLDAKVIETLQLILPPKSKSLKFINSLRDKRQRDTAISYLESYKRFWKPVSNPKTKIQGEVWKVLYPFLNPTGTDTLRMSSSNPNEQNISKKEGFNLRYCFGPLPGREWWALDYDNIELRIPAYESGEQIMIEIFEKPNDPPYFGSYHLLNISIIYPDLFWPIADQEGEFKKRYKSTWYQFGKNFGFAVQYGCMIGKPCHVCKKVPGLKCSICQGAGYYLSTADKAAHKPGAHRMLVGRLRKHAKLNQKYIDYANKHGYVETLVDKEVSTRGYPLLCTRSKYGSILPTVPLNYHVQGTACWVKLRAMVKCHEYLKQVTEETGQEHRIVLEVHDEIVFDLPKKPNGGNLPIVKKLQKIMESLGDNIGVPLTCGISYHPETYSEEIPV